VLWNGKMFLNQKPNVAARHEEMPHSGSSWAVIDSYLRIARGQFAIILSCLVLSAAVGAYYLLVTRPIFTASATMMIELCKGGIQQTSVLGDTPTDTIAIDRQIGLLVLERDKIGVSVAEKFKLANDRDHIQADDGIGSALTSLTKPFQRRNGRRA
jgi:uncharacterized protein involved in exopolysaccharide biosynthesis